MDFEALRALLEEVRDGTLGVEDGARRIAASPAANDAAARIDHLREARTGVPEVIFGEGKTAEQVAAIMAEMLSRAPRALATRVAPEVAAHVRQHVSDAVYHPLSRVLVADREPQERRGCVALLAAGTSDIPVAEEAALTAEFLGNAIRRYWDVGVAGLHRLLGVLPEVRGAQVVVVAAGMDGALPSVVAGLVAVPVIAVPTSVGYGAGAGGIAPLLTMLNACAPGVAVVNIDNGFGAGVLAGMINRGRMA